MRALGEDIGTHHQPYFLEKAKEDLVHHSAAWVVKKPERSPIFVDCHAIEDPSLDRGWDLQVKVWQRNEIGLWASGEEIQQSGELGDAYDGAGFARALAGESGAFAQIPYNVFEEVVDEHDTNYLIALAISIDALPARVTEDEASKRIRSNADQDMDARLDRTVSEQDAPSTSLDDLAEMYAGNCDDAVEVEDALER